MAKKTEEELVSIKDILPEEQNDIDTYMLYGRLRCVQRDLKAPKNHNYYLLKMKINVCIKIGLSTLLYINI